MSLRKKGANQGSTSRPRRGGCARVAEERKEGAEGRPKGADRNRWVGRRCAGRRWLPGGPGACRRVQGAAAGGGEALGNQGAGAAAGPGAGGAAPVAVASLPGAPRRCGRLRAALPAGPAPRSRVSAQPGRSPAVRAPRASPCGHGRVRAAAARRDHGGARLRQRHCVVAHHQTLRAEAPLQRRSAPRQHTSGHRWDPVVERCSALLLGLGFAGEGAGAEDARPGDAGAAFTFPLPRGETSGC